MRVFLALRFRLTLGTALTLSAPALADQVPLDRTDPGIATRQAPAPPAPPAAGSDAPKLLPGAKVSASAQPGTAGVFVGAIQIDGAKHVSLAELMQAVSPFIGRRLSPAELQDLAKTVSGVARARGYIFAHSSVPAQAIAAGVIRVELDEGRIDEVRLTGTPSDAVKSLLQELVGDAPTRGAVDRQLMLAQDLPGVRLGSARYVREGERGVLVVPVTVDRVRGRATIDNRGLSALGPVRAQLAVDVNGLLGERDVLTVQGLVTPVQPRELRVAFARYAYQLDNEGTELAVYGSYGRTHSGGAWRAYDVNGKSYSTGIGLSRPLLRGRKVSLWLTGGVDYFAIDQWASGNRVRRDRVTTANLSLNGYAPLAGGRVRAGMAVTRGLDILDATEGSDTLASRPGGGDDFTMFGGWANWTGDLVGPLSARLAVTGQLSTAPLLAIEQITIGGPVFGRGYDYSERSGDRGVLGSAELRLRLLDRSGGLVRWIQLYGFGDAATVGNLRNDYGTGSLYSAGAGARLNLSHGLSMSLEAAFPIDEIRYGSGDKAPRISASLGAQF